MARYEFLSSEDCTVFQFESVGPRGTIKKQVEFQFLRGSSSLSFGKGRQIFNLAFGDLNPETNEIDDFAVTNNGDAQKVLATVEAIVQKFFESYPGIIIFFEGSTNVRTRLYRMSISRYLAMLCEKYEIWGWRNENWEVFQQDRDYKSFLVLWILV